MPIEKRLSREEVFQKLQNLLKRKPPPPVMRDEVRMMGLKIRPINADMISLNAIQPHLLDMLWSLGKLDELFGMQFPNMSEENRTIITDVVRTLFHDFQNLTPPIRPMEIEIFKDILGGKVN